LARREATSRGRRIGLVVDGLAEPEDVGLDSTKHRGDGVAVLMGNVRDRTHARTTGNVHRMARRFNTPPGWPRPPSPEWLPGPGWRPDSSWPDPPPGWSFLIEKSLRDKLKIFHRREHPWRLLAVVILLALTCFAAYWGWLGWDHTYQVDPRTGITSGPYEPWQVVGCVLSLAAVALTAGLITRAWAAMVVMPLAFTVAWSIPASSDDTGLWGVGAIMILIGTSVGVPIVALPGAQLREYLQRRRSKRLPC
jgi:hypothetical protein